MERTDRKFLCFLNPPHRRQTTGRHNYDSMPAVVFGKAVPKGGMPTPREFARKKEETSEKVSYGDT